QVRHANGYSQRRLPVALRLVAEEIKVPVGHPIKFAEHRGPPELMREALRLLSSREFNLVAENIDAGNMKRPHGAHDLSHAARLRSQRLLPEHVPAERNVMLLTPGADCVAECPGKSLGRVIVIPIARNRR